MNILNVEHYFACPVYTVDKPDFLQVVSRVSEEYLERVRAERQLDEIYPVHMSGGYQDDPRLREFTQFIGDAAYSALDTQGYNIGMFNLGFSEMWTQEHHKHSSMEQHVHGYGAVMVGFYFLETPDDCSRVVFHDPRPGKVMIDLPEKDVSVASMASQAINFTPKPGLMMLANSWLPHSFSRHRPEKPIKFVHFNVIARPSTNPVTPQVEVV